MAHHFLGLLGMGPLGFGPLSFGPPGIRPLGQFSTASVHSRQTQGTLWLHRACTNL